MTETWSYYLNQIAHGGDSGVAREMFARRSLRVDTANAKCSFQRDEDMIRAWILKEGGYEAMDIAIFELRSNMMAKFTCGDTQANVGTVPEFDVDVEAALRSDKVASPADE